MGDNVYSILFGWVVRNLFPGIMLRSVQIAMADCLVKPVESLHTKFLTFRTDSIYKLTHNSQVVYLQAALNDSFDSTLRRIVIKNAEIKPQVWFYEIAEDKPVYFYEVADDEPVYFREESEFLGGGNDFTVQVPMDLKPADGAPLTAYLIRMRALVDYYKLYSKGYTIEFITI
ncbi:MAG: hypothetical protein ITG00_00120 [Flavobacterium sp.]|nr:hypothetical protein [Flavobacterium sp.]